MWTYQSLISNKLPCQPKEWFFKVVVRLSRDIVVLKVLLAVKGDSLSFDFALLHINLISTQNYGDILANSDEVTYITVSVLIFVDLT